MLVNALDAATLWGGKATRAAAKPITAIPMSASTSVQATFASGVPVAADLDSIGPNHYTGTITLSTAGDWNLQIIVEPTQGQSILLTSAVPIPG